MQIFRYCIVVSKGYDNSFTSSLCGDAGAGSIVLVRLSTLVLILFRDSTKILVCVDKGSSIDLVIS